MGGSTSGSGIPTRNLKVLLDVSNPNCVDVTQSITDATELNNLYGWTDIHFKPFISDTSGMSYVLDANTGNYNYAQVGTGTLDSGWVSNVDLPMTTNYTFHCWFKFLPGATQRTENIYGGGFNGRTSFYLVPSGTSSSHGVLRYSDAGSSNSYSRTSSGWGGNDGNWHLFSSVDRGTDGNKWTYFYVDGELKNAYERSVAHDIPDGLKQMTWGSWSGSYGNFGGESNLYMYYDIDQTDDEVERVFQATRSRFGV